MLIPFSTTSFMCIFFQFSFYHFFFFLTSEYVYIIFVKEREHEKVRDYRKQTHNEVVYIS